MYDNTFLSKRDMRRIETRLRQTRRLLAMAERVARGDGHGAADERLERVVRHIEDVCGEMASDIS